MRVVLNTLASHRPDVLPTLRCVDASKCGPQTTEPKVTGSNPVGCIASVFGSGRFGSALAGSRGVSWQKTRGPALFQSGERSFRRFLCRGSIRITVMRFRSDQGVRSEGDGPFGPWARRRVNLPGSRPAASFRFTPAAILGDRLRGQVRGLVRG